MRFKEALDTTMNIDKEFETNYDFIQYGDDGKQSFTAASIIKNAYNTAIYTGLYIEPRKMCLKKLSYKKTWEGFKKFFA